MKKILGLDLGTNSIGWALIEQDFDKKEGKILGMGSRIIPMGQDIKDEFGKGNSISQTAERTGFRSIRRLRERHLLRRDRLHRVLNILEFLPAHYANQIDFEKNFGKFKDQTEPKLAYNEAGFIFKKSFYEMLDDFKLHQPQLVSDGRLVPYDWTIYYLRKKALARKIEKEELAWLILNFNQKRGYYQLRGEEVEDNPNKLVEFHSLKVIDVNADEKPNSKGETWYSMHLENGWIYRRSSKTPLFDWKDKVRDFIVTTDLNDDGSVKTDSEGVEKRSFRAPKEDDWTLLKKKTEQDIDQSNKTVGEYIYDTLLQNPNQKVRGKLVRTIERKFYKEELSAILKKQIELQPELFTEEKLNECIRELYRNNIAQQVLLESRDFIHLFVNDIIFYQRPLRSQKSNIGKCTLEYREYKSEDKDGKEIKLKEYLKAIPKSHPLYQEFRLWQWMYNLKIYTKDDDKDVTAQFLQSDDDWERLFDFLNTKKEVGHKDILDFLLTPMLNTKYPDAKPSAFKKELAKEVAQYRWNYVFDDSKEKEDEKSKKYPCNETAYQIISRLDKVKNMPTNFLTKEKEIELWHIIYSVTDKVEFEKALKTFAKKSDLDIDSFIENFVRFKSFDSDYGAYSEKAIKKLLPLMRLGKYWSWENIDNNTQNRIDKIITGEYDEDIKTRVREKALHLSHKKDFQGLQLWLAQYIVYDRHSEADIAGKWNSVNDLEEYLHKFNQHSLRNPIVEQVVTETLRVVRDIWKQYGNGIKDFFDEIHIELGREMKNTADERKRLTNIVTENENTNLRIKAMLAEFINDSNIENVRPYSPMQMEALRIYEDGVLNSGIDIPDDITKISRSAQPTKAEFQRYKLWLDQKYKSPYTGVNIPLSKLFTEQYQIEHIIPQARFFDDSFSNKIICESAVNQLKDKQLGFEFIKNHQGETVETGFGKTVKILSVNEYETLVKEYFKNNRVKRNKLLMDEIPEKMITRQLNDTRYISKFVSNLLSNIVRSEQNDDGINSKNVLPGNGKVTNTLKQDWGLNDVWNDIILPRFERMNELTQTNHFTAKNSNAKTIPAIPLELSKGFQKKRIDHRHHALDALIIACATRDHINLLNNQSAKSETTRYDLQQKLREKESYFNSKENRTKEKFTSFIKPWNSFTQDARNELEHVVVSFKQNLRVINKTSNRYEKYVEKHGRMVKEKVQQTKGDSWAIRKPMHKDTVSGLIQLRKRKEVSLSAALDNYKEIVDRKFRNHIEELIAKKYDKKKLIKLFKDDEYQWNGNDISRVEIYYWEYDNVASRVNLDTTFTEKRIKETITDTGIQKILLAHLDKYSNRLDDKGKIIPPETLAFTPEGIDEMNKNIVQLNNGKFHQPIYKVRTYEPKGNKFQVGTTGNKKDKYVEAAQGTNLFFAIYQDKNGKRSYETIPLNIVIERQKQGLSSVPEMNGKGDKLLFHLSPEDLIYIATEDERENLNMVDCRNLTKEQIERIFFVNDFSGTTCYFRPYHIAKSIVAKEVDMNYDHKRQRTTGSFDTKTASFKGSQIKEICIKLKIDRLGNISKA